MYISTHSSLEVGRLKGRQGRCDPGHHFWNSSQELRTLRQVSRIISFPNGSSWEGTCPSPQYISPPPPDFTEAEFILAPNFKGAIGRSLSVGKDRRPSRCYIEITAGGAYNYKQRALERRPISCLPPQHPYLKSNCSSCRFNKKGT